MMMPQVVIDLGFTRLDVLRSLLPHEYDAFARDANLTPGQVLCDVSLVTADNSNFDYGCLSFAQRVV